MRRQRSAAPAERRADRLEVEAVTKVDVLIQHIDGDAGRDGAEQRQQYALWVELPSGEARGRHGEHDANGR